jgi:hypothetical protein
MAIATKTDKLGRDSALPEAYGIRFCEISFFDLFRFRANLNPNSSNSLSIDGKRGQVAFLPVRTGGKNRPVPIFPTTLISD